MGEGGHGGWKWTWGVDGHVEEVEMGWRWVRECSGGLRMGMGLGMDQGNVREWRRKGKRGGVGVTAKANPNRRFPRPSRASSPSATDIKRGPATAAGDQQLQASEDTANLLIKAGRALSAL